MTTTPPHPRARLTGLAYAAYFITAIVGDALIKGLVVSGDAAATANHLLAHPAQYRAGLAIGLIANLLYVALTALLYALLEPVSRRVSLLAAFCGLVGCAVQVAGSVCQIAPLTVLAGGPWLSVFNEGQLDALALLLLQLHTQAVYLALVFFACYDLVVGFLIFRSAFLPRFLGGLMGLAGLGWLSFLWPPLASRLSPGVLILGFVAELVLMLWLLVRGVDVRRWQEQAAAGEKRRF